MHYLTQSDHNLIESLIHYMFPETAERRPDATRCCGLWFKKSTSTDREIRELFGVEVNAALRGEYNHWMYTARGALGLMILVDQFPRNIFRDRREMFSGDKIATKIIEAAAEWEKELSPVQQLFVPCLILTHKEDLAVQAQCLKHYSKIESRLPEEFHGFRDIFQRHYDVIKLFNRFPHRNEVLERPSTPVEQQFIDNPTHRFDLAARINPDNGSISFGRSEDSLWPLVVNHLKATNKIDDLMNKDRLTLSKPNISQKKEDDYRVLFGQIDADGDGRLDFENLKKLFESSKKEFSSPKLKKFMQHFSSCKCCSEKICFNQFVSLMEADFSDSNNPTIDEFFDMFTKDGSTVIREEFIACLSAMNSRLTSEEIESMFDAADPHRKGKIHREQFRKFLITYHTEANTPNTNV